MTDNDDGAYYPKQGGKLIPVKKGEVKNPRGRPIGSVNIETILKAILNHDVERMDHYELSPKQQSIMKHMMSGLIAKGLGKEGDIDSIDLKAIDMVMDRIEGKAVVRNKDVTDPWKELVED